MFNTWEMTPVSLLLIWLIDLWLNQIVWESFHIQFQAVMELDSCKNSKKHIVINMIDKMFAFVLVIRLFCRQCGRTIFWHFFCLRWFTRCIIDRFVYCAISICNCCTTTIFFQWDNVIFGIVHWRTLIFLQK